MLKKFMLPLLLIVVGLGLGLSFFQGPVALRLMAMGLKQNMDRDLIAEWSDGLHVILCGAGGPLPDPNRSGPCVAVVAGDRLFVVDAGSGAARSLAATGLQPPRVEAVFLTHFHSDHIDGLGELATLRWAGSSATTPMPVYGPEGIVEVTQGFNQAYRLDSVYRTAHHGPETVPPTGAGLSPRSFPEPTEGEGTVVLESGGLRVTMFRVDHPPISPAVGYRFDYKERSVLVSGDTSKSANVARFAKGVDLLVHEALSPKLMGVIESAAGDIGNRGMAKIAADVLTYHATPVEAAEIAETAKVGHLLYYHVVPPLPVPGLKSVFLEGVSTAYDGPVTVGKDGTRISLPSGSQKIDAQ